MPLAKYFRGKGEQVLSDMQDRYGDDKGKKVFYATAEKRGMKPSNDKPKRKTVGARLGALARNS
jgi:hypothetical protein